MKKILVCVLRVGGTNCDWETKRAFDDLGAKARIVHINQLTKREDELGNYDVLVIPGGFSYGDHVRAGAIWGRQLLSQLGDGLKAFVEEGKPILGICNGFQVLVEMGLLPGFDGFKGHSRVAALAPNASGKFECRWVRLKHENAGKCVFTKKLSLGSVVEMPVAHVEGRFVLPKGEEDACLRKLVENDQVVFRYCDEKGEYANGRYPENPNGSFYDIAGICNPGGNVFGLMPHPERACYGWQLPKRVSNFGDGMVIFESVIEHLKRGL